MAVQITKINKALSLGKTQGARKLLEEFYLAEDKRQWTEAKQAEYDELYPTYRDMTTDEYKEWFTENVLGEDAEDIPPKIEIEQEVSFTDWLNETRVLSEAVEANYDEDGIELTPYQPEVTELVRPYVASDVTPLVEAYIGSKYAELRASAYPPMADYLDAVVKNDTIAIQKYIDACLAVKAKYPKE